MEYLRVDKNEATAARRRVYFHLVDYVDGMTPETGEAGGQPQVSVDGGSWTDTGIGVLTHIGNGRYYADLTQALVNVDDAVIQTRYKSANTAECPGDTVVVNYTEQNESLVDQIETALGGASVVVTVPVATDGDVTIYNGDDYAEADGRHLTWTNTGDPWPDLTAATVTLYVRFRTAISSYQVTVTQATAPDQAFKLELTDVQTSAMDLGAFGYEVIAALASGNKVTLCEATWTVR